MTPFPVILKRAALKNPGCRRTCSGKMPFYGRGPRVPRRGIADAQDDRVGEAFSAQDDRVPFRMTGCRSG